MDSTAHLMNRKTAWLGGIVVFIISFLVYVDTIAPTTSFWDCGEFIACSKILGVMHPPGAPLYMLIGRCLTMLPFVKDIGLRVNLFSAFVSAATVLLTFLIIVQLIQRWRGKAQNWEDRWIIYGGGILGALAFAFTDSFWFNAVEAEVYAFSMLFTALVVWLALLWGERSEKAGSLLLIYLIFYLFGLAVGVHLLNILAFPFVLLIAYFHHNQLVRRLLLLLFVQAAVPITLYVILFQFDTAGMYYHQIVAHQQKASAFLLRFGLIWTVATLIFIFIKDRRVFNAWWVIPILGVLAYAIYFVIYIRANLQPPINENNPSTLKAMMDYLARKQYGTEDILLTFIHRKAEFWTYQIQKMYIRYFGWQFIGQGVLYDARDRIVEIISFKGLYGLPFFLGIWGAIHHFSKDWKRATAVLVLFILTGIAIIVYLNQPDPQPRERDYSYVGSFFAFALWIGIGAASLFEWIVDVCKGRKSIQKVAFVFCSLLIFIAVPLNLFAYNYRSHNRSGNYVAYDYSLNMLESCEPNAILFTNGDNDTFPLWFLQEVYHIRQDVRVVNLSLLNTPWYIQQLRDVAPKIPINWSDEMVKEVGPIGWKERKVSIPVPPQVVQNLKEENPSLQSQVQSEIVFTLKPTFRTSGGGGIRVQDQMVLEILNAVQWKRPVYFAVTVSETNQINLEPYLRMDGLTFKVLPYKTPKIDPRILEEKLFQTYQYRGLNNPKIYFNRSIIRLLQNYRSAFHQLALFYIRKGDKEKAVSVLEKMEQIIPDEVIPYSSELSALWLEDMSRQAGLTNRLDQRLKHVLPGRILSRQERFQLAGYYTHVFKNYSQAEKKILKLVQKNPDDVEALSFLIRIYDMAKTYDKAVLVLENWLTRHQDPGAEKELARYRKLAAESEKSYVQSDSSIQ